jgi:hypothetical protein
VRLLPGWDEEIKMNEKESAILICQLVSHGSPIIPGSIKDICSKCGEPVWVSPSSLLLQHDNPGVPIYCVGCTLKLPHTWLVDAEIVPFNSAQIADLEEYLQQ